jgi:tRNA(Ile)-lysidine synthetase-like protein
MDLVRQVEATIQRHALVNRDERVVVGVSGGPDSLCLLHVLLALGQPGRAAHLNHSLRGAEADADAAFVEQLCATWGVPCVMDKRDVPALARARHVSVEEAARQERYAFLGEVARGCGARTVAVAHHADDQVETVLMHFLRGAGLGGLRGMLPVSWLDEMRLGRPVSVGDSTECLRLVRPLLGVPRAAIEAYCAALGITPRYDRSNLDTTYLRNRIRHELIPLLETYNPNLRTVLRHTAEAIAGDYDLLRAQIEQAWADALRHEAGGALAFDLAALRCLPVGLQRSLLREAIHRLRASLRDIGWVHIEEALHVLNAGQVGAQATLPAGLALTLDYDLAWIGVQGAPSVVSSGPTVTGPVTVALPGETRLADGWRLAGQVAPISSLDEAWRANMEPYVAYLDAERLAAPVTLRPRRAGDWCEPLGLGHRQRVRELMINCKVPRAMRDRVPLLVCGEAIAWVVGWRVDARFALGPQTRRVAVWRWIPPEEKDQNG